MSYALCAIYYTFYFYFFDQKTTRTKRLNAIDAIPAGRERWEAALTGVLVGNFIDWGAKAVTQLIERETDQLIGFEAAAAKIQVLSCLFFKANFYFMVFQ